MIRVKSGGKERAVVRIVFYQEIVKLSNLFATVGDGFDWTEHSLCDSVPADDLTHGQDVLL